MLGIAAAHRQRAISFRHPKPVAEVTEDNGPLIADPLNRRLLTPFRKHRTGLAPKATNERTIRAEPPGRCDHKERVRTLHEQLLINVVAVDDP